MRMSTVLSLIAASILVTSSASATVLLGGYTDTSVVTLSGTPSYGDVAADAAGNRYVTNNNAILKITPAGVTSTLATLSSQAMSLEIIDGNLYVGSSSGKVSKIAIATGAVTILATRPVSASLHSVTASIDDSSLFFATSSGMAKYSIATNSFSNTSMLNGLFTGIATRADGSILVSSYNDAKIYAYNPTLNTSSVFYTGLASVGALSIDASTGDIYAALENMGKIVRINAAGTSVTDFATMTLNNGYYPTAMDFSQDGKVLSYLSVDKNYSTYLGQIQGFAGTGTVPEPGTLALFGLALAGLGVVRRKRA